MTGKVWRHHNIDLAAEFSIWLETMALAQPFGKKTAMRVKKNAYFYSAVGQSKIVVTTGYL